jgi:hypothetical protein
VLLAVSGGFRVTVGGLRLSARSPLPASVAAGAVLAAWYFLARKSNSVSRDLEDAWRFLDGRASIITVIAGIASAVVAASYATFAAAGADASGYLSEAELFTSGRLFHRDTLASIVGGWQTGLTSPLGWRPAPLEGFQSPTYAPGLPLLMAIPHWAGGPVAACWVVVASAAIAVWSTGMVALRLAGGVAAIVGAVVLAVSPVFIYQSVQPMSDVPVTAAWMLCWWLIGWIDKPKGLSPPAGLSLHTAPRGDTPLGVSFLAGVACAIAVLIRPNLAPLAVVPLVFVTRRVRDAVAFALPVAIAGLALLWLQWQWYGSPLRSGYGTAGELFALANIGPNAMFYLGWLVSTAPIMFLAIIGVWLIRRDRLTWALAAFAALVVAAYLVYAVFEDWSYLRFLLPALAVGSVLVGVAVDRMIAGIPVAARAAVALGSILAIAATGIANARALDAFSLEGQHHRIGQLGGHLNGALPENAVIVAGEQSGSMRYYTSRPIVRWDAATPGDLTRALAALEAADRPVWFVLDAWEEEPFRARFMRVPAGSLDWPPAVTAGTTHRTNAWQLSDRQRFMRGESVPPVRLAASPSRGPDAAARTGASAARSPCIPRSSRRTSTRPRTPPSC